jgi:predicted phosphatase
LLTNADNNKLTIILQSKFTIIRPKNYKKSLLCGLISQISAEKRQKPLKNGGVRKAN